MCLAALLTFSLVACGKKPAENTPNSTSGTEGSTPSTEAPTTEAAKANCITPPDEAFNFQKGVLLGFVDFEYPALKIPSEIGGGAFEWCDSLQEITIPDSVTEFGDSMFDDCDALETVNLSNQTTEIQWNTFGNCKSLKQLTVPASVTKIEGRAIYNCEQLKDIYLTENVTDLDVVSFPEGVTIHASAGSYAEEFAQKYNFPFENWNPAK